MTTLTPSSLKMTQKRSSSCTNCLAHILNKASPVNSPYHKNSPQHKIGFLQNSFDLNDSLESPGFPRARSVLDYCEPSRFKSYRSSTRPSTIKLSPKTNTFEDYTESEDVVDLELLIQDDEEISPKELPTPKQSDFDISINLVINEIIASANASVSYPCHVSIKPKEEYTSEKLSVDLSIILDIKNHGLSTINTILNDFLTQINETDRLALFSTQKGNTKRFPFSIMHQDAKHQFLEELDLLAQNMLIPVQELSLPQVLRATIKSVRDRKYRNHISAIFLLTDNTEESDFSRLINKEAKEISEENPLVFAFGIGQKHNAIGLQEVCEAFEGKYCHVETPESLNGAMVACLSELSYIRIKDVKISFEVEAKDIDDDTLRIAKVYEKKTIVEESSGFVEAHVNYFSMNEGIDIALELEVSKCTNLANEHPYHIVVCLNGNSVTQCSEVSIAQQKELNISKMHPLLRMMPKKIDKKALESFYRVKVAKIVSYAVKMAGDGYLKQSLQSLNNVKKELYTFTMLRSEALQKLMKTIECTLNNLQNSSFRAKEKMHAFRGLNSMVGI